MTSALGVTAIIGILALAVWVLPLTVRGGGWPTGTIRVATPLVDDPALFERTVAASTGERYDGFDITTGDRRWRSEPCPGAGPAGLTSSQEGPVLVVRCDGTVRGLDLRTGAFRWSYDPEGAWTMLRVGGGLVVIALTDHADVVDLATGELRFRWKGEHVEEQELIVAADDDGVFIGEDDQVISLGPDGEERWREPMFSGSITRSGPTLVVRDREAFELVDPQTGERRIGFELTSVVRGSMFVAEDGHTAVLARSDEDSMGVYGLDLKNWVLHWRQEGARFLSAGPRHFAIDDGGTCKVLRITTGKTVARCSTPGWSTTGVGLDADRVAIVGASPRRTGSTIVVRNL